MTTKASRGKKGGIAIDKYERIKKHSLHEKNIFCIECSRMKIRMSAQAIYSILNEIFPRSFIKQKIVTMMKSV
jgi:transcriptional regulator CtsR